MTKFETLANLQQRLTAVLDTVERELVPLSAGQLRWKPAPTAGASSNACST